MQQLALMYLMQHEAKEAGDLEWERFKMSLVAHNPGQAKEILEALEEKEEDAGQVGGVPLSEEGYAPDEREWMLEELRRLGFVVRNT